MGPKTSAALREFQQSQGLQASGQLDGPTLVALEVGSSGMSSSSGASRGTMSPTPSPSSTQSGTQSDGATPHSAGPSRQSSGGSAQTGG
jgi:peptidoglycan hydrolase-like protein with peptidoglycan-binding domain